MASKPIFLQNSTDKNLTVGIVTLDTETSDHVKVHIKNDNVSRERVNFEGDIAGFIKDGTYTATINDAGDIITFKGDFGSTEIEYTRLRTP